MKYISALIILLISLFFYSCRAIAAQLIEAWSYYSAPPFQINAAQSTGLSFDLVNYLNHALAGKYEIRLLLLPRARLTMMLEQGNKAVVIFTPSMLFNGPENGPYLWSRAIVGDQQEFVSRKDLPFEYSDPTSLIGSSFAAILGHVYPPIKKEMDSGMINAQRTVSESSLLSMLMAHHVDVITIPNSSYRYFTHANAGLRSTLVVSKNNLGAFTRHLMFQQGMQKERDDFEQVVVNMATDPGWVAILHKYGLKPTVIPPEKQ